MADADLTRIPAARVPITGADGGMVTREWYRFFFRIFETLGGGQANSVGTDVTGMDLAPSYTPQVNRKRHGVFYDTSTQTAALINTAYPITLNSTQISDGVYIGTPTSRVYVDRPGTYNFQFSLQLNKANASTKSVYLWYRINGVDANYSATAVALAGSSAASVAAWNFVVELNAGDYFELVWSTDDTGCQIQAAATAAPVPAIPSVILTVTDNIN